MIPGEVRVREAPVQLNEGRERQSVVVVNDGDRPIQVGSHLHFPDANPALNFDRDATRGYRLDLPAGTSVRFEPGVSRTVDLVQLGGTRYIPGLQIHATGLPTHDRGPRKVVPFGTPGAEPDDKPHPPPRAGARVTGTADDQAPSETSTQPSGGDDSERDQP